LNIVILNPPYPYKVIREGRCQHEAAIWDSVYPPLSLATIASYLRDAHKVSIIDAIAEEKDLSSLLQSLEELKPDLIISSISTPTIEEDLKVLKQLKDSTRAKIAIFGVHATYFADELIREDYIDYVILNDPELSAFQIASGDSENFEGVVYKSSGKIIRLSSEESKISSFRIPSWDLVDLEKYKIPIKKKKYVLVSTARGCPFDCSFCVVPYYYGKKVRFREVSEVIEELKVVSRYADEVFFHTDLFTLKKDYVLRLGEQIIREKINIHWICNSRVDTFDREMAEMMKKAGCWMVSFGIESGSQEILDLCRKKITLDQSREAVQVARDAGLISIGHFVLGIPGETLETIRQTLHFSKELDPDFAEFYIATPFPGSDLFEKVKEKISLNWKDIRYDYDPYQYQFNLEKLRREAYFQFYLRPSKVFRYIQLFGAKKIIPMSLSAFRFVFSFFAKK
jgi:radical SAM superfamily enzyme YgiQ (UPF0313 family)